jgi:hypothetical protein
VSKARFAAYESSGLPKSVVGWIINHSTRNFWRVADWYELDDLISDGLLVAYKCRERYGEPGKDLDPPHFMALVKTSFYRHIGDLLRVSRAEQEVTVRIGDAAGESSEASFLDRAAEPAEGGQDFLALLADMPESLRKAVALFFAKKGPRVHLEGADESEAEWLKRLADFPLRHDFETELRAYLWESSHA